MVSVEWVALPDVASTIFSHYLQENICTPAVLGCWPEAAVAIVLFGLHVKLHTFSESRA